MNQLDLLSGSLSFPEPLERAAQNIHFLGEWSFVIVSVNRSEQSEAQNRSDRKSLN